LGRRTFRSAGPGAELEKDCANIAMLLRDRPPGTTANITGEAVLYWDGGRLYGAHLSADEPRVVAEPFELEDVLPDVRDAVADWLARPRFTFRASLLEWLEDAPPGNASR
jgi:hypothetical protein